jgi:hypothetical protein
MRIRRFPSDYFLGLSFPSIMGAMAKGFPFCRSVYRGGVHEVVFSVL